MLGVCLAATGDTEGGIATKLDVRSRTEAAAVAHRHGLEGSAIDAA